MFLLPYINKRYEEEYLRYSYELDHIKSNMELDEVKTRYILKRENFISVEIKDNKKYMIFLNEDGTKASFILFLILDYKFKYTNSIVIVPVCVTDDTFLEKLTGTEKMETKLYNYVFKTDFLTILEREVIKFVNYGIRSNFSILNDDDYNKLNEDDQLAYSVLYSNFTNISVKYFPSHTIDFDYDLNTKFEDIDKNEIINAIASSAYLHFGIGSGVLNEENKVADIGDRYNLHNPTKKDIEKVSEKWDYQQYAEFKYIAVIKDLYEYTYRNKNIIYSLLRFKLTLDYGFCYNFENNYHSVNEGTYVTDENSEESKRSLKEFIKESEDLNINFVYNKNVLAENNMNYNNTDTEYIDNENVLTDDTNNTDTEYIDNENVLTDDTNNTDTEHKDNN